MNDIKITNNYHFCTATHNGETKEFCYDMFPTGTGYSVYFCYQINTEDEAGMEIKINQPQDVVRSRMRLVADHSSKKRHKAVVGKIEDEVEIIKSINAGFLRLPVPNIVLRHAFGTAFSNREEYEKCVQSIRMTRVETTY